MSFYDSTIALTSIEKTFLESNLSSVTNVRSIGLIDCDLTNHDLSLWNYALTMLMRHFYVRNSTNVAYIKFLLKKKYSFWESKDFTNFTKILFSNFLILTLKSDRKVNDIRFIIILFANPFFDEIASKEKKQRTHKYHKSWHYIKAS